MTEKNLGRFLWYDLMTPDPEAAHVRLTRPFTEGETVTVTLEFEVAGPVVVEIPVDLQRMDGHGGATN